MRPAGSNCVIHDTSAGYSNGNHGIRLFDAMECTGHERVITDCVSKDYKLGACNGGLVLGEFRRLLDDIAHERDGVHIDASTRRCHVNGTANGAGSR